MTTPALTVRDLTVRYNGGSPVVSGYEVDLMPGTLTVILGRNGAGKTSTLRGITGFLSHESGSSTGTIVVHGVPVRRPNPLRLSRLGVGLVAERDKIFGNMRVRDQLRLVTDKPADLDEVLGFFPRLAERLDVRAGLLSGGERQMLATALLLLRKPRVLLVDEMSLGLAPKVAAGLLVMLRDQAVERGVGVLLVEQHVPAALKVVDRGYALAHGRLVHTGTAAELRADPDVLASAYLGSAATE